MTCTWFELLARIPWPGLRLRWCARHAERCPRCRQASESWEALSTILIRADQLPPELDLWPEVQSGLGGAAVAPLPAPRSWRWAYVAAMLAMIVASGYWVLQLGRSMEPSPATLHPAPASHVRLFTAKIADRPARVFRFQSRNPDRTIFWIEKNDKRS